MSVYERSNGWYINIQIRGKRIHRKVADTKEKALEIQRSYRQAAKEYRQENKGPSRTFDHTAREFLQYVKDTLSERTHDLYSGDYENHLEPFFHFSFLHSIDNNLILKFQAHQKRKKYRGKTLSNRTVNIHISLISKIISFAVRKGYITAPGLKYPMLREPKRLYAFFSRGEWDNLLEKLSRSLAGKRIRFGRLTGMRPKELAFLSWSDIDIPSRYLKIQSKPKYGFRIKTDEERMIPLSQEAIDILNDIPKISQWIFSTKKLPVLDIRKALKSASKKAGITKPVTPGMLRHTFATHALAAGADIQAVQQILGHKNLETTFKYTHALKESMQNAVDVLSKKS